MSLEHGILGYLSIKPSTGYELKKMIDTTASHFWAAEHPQIYKALKTLETRGLVTIKEVSPGRKLEKKVYELTPAGKKELVRWLENEDYSDYIAKSPVVMQCFFSGNLPLEDQILLVERYYQAAKRMDKILLNFFQEKTDELYNAPPDEMKKLLPAHKTYRYSVMRNQAYLKWLEICLKELNEERKTIRRQALHLQKQLNRETSRAF